jgi:VWFA-related protein
MDQRKIARAAVLAICLAGMVRAAGSGTPRPGAGQEPAQPKLQYEVSVILKLLQVRVTDKKGHPVRDLTVADFVVTDNGQPVTLTEFERHSLEGQAEATEAAAEPAAPAAAAQAAPPVRPMNRKYFLFFDFAYNNVRGIQKAQKAALHFLGTVARPEDEVAVLTYSAVRGLAVREYLTADHAKVRQVLEAIGHRDVAGRATQIEDQYWRLMQETPGSGAGVPMGINLRAEAEANRQESRSMAQKYMLKLAELARALRLVEGQKDFILFSSGVPNSLIYGYTPDTATFRGPVGSGGVSGDQVLRDLNEAMYKEFSAAGCSFYAFDTRESAMETSLFGYDEITLATGSRAMAAGATGPTDIFKDNKATGLNSLKRFTDLTGGHYYSNINLYEKNIGQVQELTGTFYVLGYAANERDDGLYHEVKVEVRRKGCEVRTQAGYFNPKPYADYSDLEKRIHLFDLAVNERAFSRLPVNVPVAALASAADGVSRLAVLARIPGDVSAKFAGRRVEFVALFFDGQGDVRRIVRDETDAAPLRGREMAFAAQAELKAGDYACRLVVRDMDSGQSVVASAKAKVGDPAAPGIVMGTPLLLEARPGCRLLAAKAGTEKGAFAWTDIYPYDSSVFTPLLGEAAAAGAGLQAVVPCAAPGGAPSGLTLAASLVDAVSGRAAPIGATMAGWTERGPFAIATLGLETASVPPGTYYLHVYAADKARGLLGHAFTTLVLR